MKQIVDHFDRAYIINLRERTDRRQQTIKEFAKIGIDVPSARVQFHTADRPTDRAGFPSIGARGSFTSHLKILDLARQGGLQNVLVFEDDIGFEGTATDAVERIACGLSGMDWDVVYFGRLAPGAITASEPLAAWDGPTTGGHFYGVNGAFIGRMAEFMHACESRPPGHPHGGPMFRDGAYNHVRRVMPDVRVLLANPNLATQRSSRTDLHALRVYDRVACLRPLVNALRSVKNRFQVFGM